MPYGYEPNQEFSFLAGFFERLQQRFLSQNRLDYGLTHSPPLHTLSSHWAEPFMRPQFEGSPRSSNRIRPKLDRHILAVGIFLITLAHSGGVTAGCSAGIDELLKLPFDQLVETEINVASKILTAADQQPAAVTVVNREQLQLSGARTLNEALMVYVPGFFMVEDQDDNIAAFRGLAADNNSKVMMLLNGHNLNAEWFWGPPDAILNSNNFDWIERIEVIRGPGSVTLGQGALLGVINIVTRKAEQLVSGCQQHQAHLLAGGGLNNMWQGGGEWAYNDQDYDAFVHINQSNYDGQALRREGWAADQAFLGYEGGVVADAGQRLKRTENLSLFSHLRYQQLSLDVLHIDQTRDLYNFYRDRNQFEQAITYVGLTHRWQVNPKMDLESKANIAVDDYTLHSIAGGLVTGGTQESRYGFQEVLRINDVWQGHKLALGAEFHLYDFGQTNAKGDNFLINVLSPENRANLDALKQSHTYVYPASVNVYSFFLENNYQIIPRFTLFGGLRYDKHQYWGGNLSPRAGAFVVPWDDGQFRLSYQEGFRGAVGIHYSGCCRHDGFLREDNFDQIEGTIPGFSNLPAIKPENIQSLELAFNQRIDAHWQFDNVLFYSITKNIIDVGGIFFPPGQPLPPIGTDVPGSNNNYWFFKNNTGSIEQLGFEASARYAIASFNATVSHAYVDILSASDQNLGSMYVGDTGEIRAVPPNVTRLNLVWKPLQKVSLGVNYLFYSDWFATNGQQADGGHLLNAAFIYNPWRRLELTFNIKNILGENNLYPMNNNVTGATSNGTPALEETTFWLKTKLELL